MSHKLKSECRSKIVPVESRLYCKGAKIRSVLGDRRKVKPGIWGARTSPFGAEMTLQSMLRLTLLWTQAALAKLRNARPRLRLKRSCSHLETKRSQRKMKFESDLYNCLRHMLMLLVARYERKKQSSPAKAARTKCATLWTKPKSWQNLGIDLAFLGKEDPKSAKLRFRLLCETR